MARQFDWHGIRVRYLRGESAYAISKALGGHPSKQAIQKRAKNERWAQVAENDLAVAEGLPITDPDGYTTQGSRLGLRCKENIALILRCAELGLPNHLIASAVGIGRDTLRRWQQDDPSLAAEMQSRRARKVSRWIGRIDDASETDWKAADRLLQVSPETREMFGSRKTTGNAVQVVLNIGRADEPSRIIAGVATSATPGS